MKDVMGIIYTGERDDRLRELTITRAIAALPVAGRFRIIDFLMSSMVNSGMRNVGVIMQKNYHSLMDHLGSGKEWDLHGKNDGLYILPPFLTRENVGLYSGMLDALRSNSSYLRRSRQEYVILTNSHIIYNYKFDDMIAAHIDNGADITMLYTKDPSMQKSEANTYLAVDEEGRVTDMEIEPTNPSNENTFMEVYLMKRELLRTMVDQGVAHGLHDLTRDVIQRLVADKSMKVCGFEFKDKAWQIDSVQSYYRFNMDLLKADTLRSLFSEDRPVYTKVRDEMPARYEGKSEVVNSLIADGSIIEGRVENSILFRSVRIAPDAVVKNCIIMQDAEIQSGAQIENCILDKQAVIKRNARLIGPAAYPIVVAKNVVI
ncbi:MAG: glucose-1-phosphate adenylyltransferase subunit GlgD [Eubacteriales bacterium]|nr:glucose-1-phosphate adenylyltransferase subunit GlgD [Eubacteriales bacterium]MDD3881505.1 glucose-1-phosphate adenylyltransferase subunit GlgD [Eubacteriales bacterium]MDD4513013.1 glucose-1-phosphate adenylyltransferase subunit GlgD [Eubacteriales bacterium]